MIKQIALRVEYWDPKIHRVYQGPYLRKHWYLNGKQAKRSGPVML